jgi:DNA repair protein RadD
MKIIYKLLEKDPFLKVIGLTATPYRMKTGSLINEGGIFTDVAFDATTPQWFKWFIDNEFMAPLFPKQTHHQIDASSVKINAGEYSISGLEELVHSNDNLNKALDETIAHGQDRDCWLCFAPGIDSTIDITQMLNDKGIPTTCVHSKMGVKERNDNIEGFKSGKYRCMVNNNVLTTGFDHPPVDMIIVLRHTKSPGLWVQMLGRGTRPSVETMKHDCLVLDFCDNTSVLGPIDLPNVREPGKRKRSDSIAPMKVCGNEDCMAYNYASVRYCAQCGWEFPPPKDKIKQEASNLALMACQDEPIYELFDVTHVTYSLHQKRASRNSMRVTYMCGLKIFNEWVCFDSDSKFVRRKVVQWWNARINDIPPPVTTTEALEHVSSLRKPTRIKVIVNRKYPEIVGAYFAT